jgi:hypothetical protein
LVLLCSSQHFSEGHDDVKHLPFLYFLAWSVVQNCLERILLNVGVVVVKCSFLKNERRYMKPKIIKHTKASTSRLNM